MKKFLLLSLFFSQMTLAEETKAPPTTQPSNKITTKEAKKSCKDEGKAGPDLIKCMKEKKDEK